MTASGVACESFEQLVGKTIVIGLNYARRSDGALLEKHQLHGAIKEADSDGVVVLDSSGANVRLPPSLQEFVQARPGTYRLRATSEEVEDPDFEAIWTIWDSGSKDETWEVVTGRHG